MKKAAAFALAVLMALVLCACGGEEAAAPDPNLGKYLCTSVVLEGMELGADGEYLELQADGSCTFFFYDSPVDGTWTLNGEALSIAVPYSDMEMDVTGIWKDGVITMTIAEMGNATLTFRLESLIDQAAETPVREIPAEDTPAETSAKNDWRCAHVGASNQL